MLAGVTNNTEKQAREEEEEKRERENEEEKEGREKVSATQTIRPECRRG